MQLGTEVKTFLEGNQSHSKTCAVGMGKASFTIICHIVGLFYSIQNLLDIRIRHCILPDIYMSSESEHLILVLLS